MPAARPRSVHRSWVARVAFVAILAFVAAVLVLHAVNSGSEPAHMSSYVHTPWAPLWVLALGAFVLAGVALAVELRRRLAAHPCRRAGVAMLWLAVAGAVVLAAFPVDADPFNRTVAGRIHEEAGPPTFLLAATAMLVLAPAFRSEHGWRRYAGMSVVCGVLAFAFALAYIFATLAGDQAAGLLQRILVGFIVTWMALVAARLLRPGVVPQPPRARKARAPRPTCAI